MFSYVLHSFFFFSSRRRHTRFDCDWSSDVCSSDLKVVLIDGAALAGLLFTYGIGVSEVKSYVMKRIDSDYLDRKSTRLNSSHSQISYAVFCLKKKNKILTM